jgi:hypothetical protein
LAAAKANHGPWWEHLSRGHRARLLDVLLGDVRAHRADHLRIRLPHEATEQVALALSKAVVCMQADFAIGVTDEDIRQLFISRPTREPIHLAGRGYPEHRWYVEDGRS